MKKSQQILAMKSIYNSLIRSLFLAWSIPLLLSGCGSDPIDFFTPYNYGYQMEIQVDPEGNATVLNHRKHYVTGKYTPEQGFVLGDRRTVYLTDDGSFRGFYLFLADRPEDLSEGTLYMARFEQKESWTSSGGGGEIRWVRLGHSSDEYLENLIRRDLRFTDIYDVRNPDDCPEEEGFRRITAGDPGTMCLRPRDGEHGSRLSKKFRNREEWQAAAAFLETRKTGVLAGATAEFRKGEGIAWDGDRRLFVSFSEILTSMEDNYRNRETANQIRFRPNPCGAVFEFRLNRDVLDTDGNPVDSSYVATGTRSLIQGRYIPERGVCDDRSIANPDNLRYLKGDQLVIGEDTSLHESNRVWVLNLKGAEKPGSSANFLTPVLALPPYAESTGTFEPWLDPATGDFHLFANAQHPYDRDPEAREDLKRSVSGSIVVKGYGTDDFSDSKFESVRLPGKWKGSEIAVSPALIRNGKKYPVKFEVLFHSGDVDRDGNRVGLLMDRAGNPITMADGSERISVLPDAHSLFIRRNGPVLITHFEDSPGALYRTLLTRDGSGNPVVQDFQSVDFQEVGGTFINCAGNHTPWDTHLASEEDYYLDAYQFDPVTAKWIDMYIAYCEKDEKGNLTGRYFKENAGEDYSWWCTFVKGIATDYLHSPVQ